MVDFGRSGSVGPAQAAAVSDHSAQFAAGRHAVISTATEVQLVGVGPAAMAPIGGVVDFAAIAWYQAVGARAAPIPRVADQPLVGSGNAFLST